MAFNTTIGAVMSENRERNFTDTFVNSAKALPSRNGVIAVTEYRDTKVKGLCLRVTPAGVKSWSYRYRAKGKQKRLSLGKARVVSLADARSTVKVAIGQVASGADPVLESKLAKVASLENIELRTIKQIGDWYFAECKVGNHKPNGTPKRKSTLDLELYYFCSHIVPALGEYELADLKRAHIQKFITGLSRATDPKTGEERGSDNTAQRCKVIIQSIYTFAMRHEIIEANPAQLVAVKTIPSREKILTDAELKIVWSAFTPPLENTDLKVSMPVANAIRIAMVTLQRRGEVAGMRIDELDFENRVWNIPSSIAKNKRYHVVPLSDLAIELIQTSILLRLRESAYVFPSPRSSNENDISINAKAITRAFGRMRTAVNLKDVRPHDLRRTGATNLTSERLGFPRFIVSKVLN